jgi:hypothetical protein
MWRSVGKYLAEPFIVDEKDWTAVVKDLLTYPLAQYLRNSLPTLKEPYKRFQPSGVFRKWWKNRLRCFNKQNTHLWSSWLQTKRAALPSSNDLVYAAYETHFETLTKEDPGIENADVLDEIFSDPIFNALLDRIKDGLRPLMSVKSVRRKAGWIDLVAEERERLKPLKRYAPSRGASFDYSRKEMGQLGDIADRFMDSVSRALSTPQLIRMREVERFSKKERERERVVVSDYSPYDIESWEEFCEELETIPWSERQPTDDLPYWDHDRVLAPAKIQGIIEPMKVRVISKGPSDLYWSLKPFQKAFHSALRRIPGFHLIGEPVQPWHVDAIDDWRHPLWLSIDYSSATDGLSGKLGRGILERVTEVLPIAVRENALKALGNHELFYPSKAPFTEKASNRGKLWTYMGDQTNGQLMGSPVSFPILCIANFALYMLTRRRYEASLKTETGWYPKYRLKDYLSKVLINGDDMLYKGNMKMYQIHQDLGVQIGLQQSVGKSYVHPIYGNINSMSFHVEPGKRCQFIPFFNTGLFMGQSKVIQKTSTDQREEFEDPMQDGIVSTINELMRGTPEQFRNEMLARFIRENSDRIGDSCAINCKNKITKKHRIIRNLFLPTSVGGMGVRKPKGFKVRYSAEQRMLFASKVKGRVIATQLPAPGVVLEALPYLHPLSDTPTNESRDVLEGFPSNSIFNTVKNTGFCQLVDKSLVHLEPEKLSYEGVAILKGQNGVAKKRLNSSVLSGDPFVDRS